MGIEASPASGTSFALSGGGSFIGPSLVSPPDPALLSGLRAPTILLFDSGLGGLSVLRELVRTRPDARYVYAADDAAFPYGDWDEPALVDRILSVMEVLIARVAPDAVVIACGTASTLVLPPLRARFSVPFIGTVPAIKPACEGSRTHLISVLATPGTVKRDYTRTLIRDFASGCRVTLVGSQRLAPLVEASLAGTSVSDAEFAEEIAPCFVREGGARTDTVVLACTHYPLVRERLESLAPWPVRWVDPAPAIARRAVSLVGPALGQRAPAPLRLFSTGAPLDAGLIGRIAGMPARHGELLPTGVEIP